MLKNSSWWNEVSYHNTLQLAEKNASQLVFLMFSLIFSFLHSGNYLGQN